MLEIKVKTGFLYPKLALYLVSCSCRLDKGFKNIDNAFLVDRICEYFTSQGLGVAKIALLLLKKFSNKPELGLHNPNLASFKDQRVIIRVVDKHTRGLHCLQEQHTYK